MSINIDFENNLRTLAKGLKSGLEFESDNKTPKQKRTDKIANDKDFVAKPPETKEETINLMAMIHEEVKLIDVWPEKPNSEVKENKAETDKTQVAVSEIDDDIIQLTDEGQIPVLKISESRTLDKIKWAEELDVNAAILDFHVKVPDPAMTYSYELDNFQKQAIIKLEENCNVFVAAHTSAGKTTVAEYAISLSQKHMTR